MRIMLDTNILISTIVFDSDYLKELIEVICDKYKLVLSSFIIDELNAVVDKKFPIKKEYMNNFLYKIPYELEYIPDVKINDVRVFIPLSLSGIPKNENIAKEDFKTLIVSNDKISDGVTYSLYVDGTQVK